MTACKIAITIIYYQWLAATFSTRTHAHALTYTRNTFGRILRGWRTMRAVGFSHHERKGWTRSRLGGRWIQLEEQSGRHNCNFNFSRRLSRRPRRDAVVKGLGRIRGCAEGRGRDGERYPHRWCLGKLGSARPFGLTCSPPPVSTSVWNLSCSESSRSRPVVESFYNAELFTRRARTPRSSSVIELWNIITCRRFNGDNPASRRESVVLTKTRERVEKRAFSNGTSKVSIYLVNIRSGAKIKEKRDTVNLLF